MPFKQKISDRFVARGEVYLAARQYEKATEEFTKAQKYDRESQKVKTDIALTKEIVLDLRKGKDFFDKFNPELAKKIELADSEFSLAKAALEQGLNFLKQGEKELALISMTKASLLDPQYPEAWKNLALVYQQVANSCPKSIIPDCQQFFSQKADKAKTKLKQLDPTL